MTELWQRELERYSSLVREQQILWLSRLVFFVSMYARDTYEVGTDFVEKPAELRRFNELLHRVSSKQLDVALNETDSGVPENQFFAMLSEEVALLGIDGRELIERLR